MNEFFISYSRSDSETVDKFMAALNKAGMDPWLDRDDIHVGNSWRKEIVEAIDGCNAFVLMMSAKSVASPNVQKEIILAQDSGKPIYVVMLEVVRLPAEIRYQLAGLQFINFPLLGIDKSSAQLVDVLKPHQKKTKSGTENGRQTELVIQGVDISAFTAEKQAQLLAFVSSLANADPSQLKIANITAGSVHIFMDMPAATAFTLKTLALNGNDRFGEMDIVSLRLAGDHSFINIALGILTATATLSLLQSGWLKIQKTFASIFGAALGNILLALMAAVMVAGIGLSGLILFQTKLQAIPPPASNPPDAGPVNPILQSTLTPSPTARTRQIETATATAVKSAFNSATPTETAAAAAAPTSTITAASADGSESGGGFFNGVVSQHLACNHGPGQYYLYRYGLIAGIKLQVFGRDINSGWVYVLADGYEGKCWVNLSQIKLNGNISELKVLYPGAVKLPASFLWPAPQNVYTTRTSNGAQLAIYWDEYILADGDLEGEGSPRYLLELWLCKDGALSFNPTFYWSDNSPGDGKAGILVSDEPGCSEPSHGVIYLAEKHGYTGPIDIPWTPAP